MHGCFLHWCIAKTVWPSVLKDSLRDKLPWNFGNEFVMQEGTPRVLKTSLHTNGIVSCLYSICTQRHTNVRKCVCGHVLWCMGQREFCFQPLLSIPLWIWSYYFGKRVLFVSARVHTLMVIMVSEVCEGKSEHTCWTGGRRQPLSPLFKNDPSYYESQPKKGEKTTLVQSTSKFHDQFNLFCDYSVNIGKWQSGEKYSTQQHFQKWHVVNAWFILKFLYLP